MLTALHRLLVRVVLLPVVVYRRVLSPLKRAPSCRYLPTCSEYAMEAVSSRGIVIGGGLTIWRVLRCNPLVAGGYDPVPHRRSRGHRGLASQGAAHRFAVPVPSGPSPGSHRCGEHH